jgi:hypothetical protein
MMLHMNANSSSNIKLNKTSTTKKEKTGTKMENQEENISYYWIII